MINELKKISRKPINIFLAFLFIGFLLYGIVLKGDFIFDDYAVIDNVRQFNFGLKNIFFQLRSLAYLSFNLNLALFGNKPVFYHLFNILIHIVNSFLVYLLLHLTLKVSFFKQVKEKRQICFLGSLIFLIHPLQTQAVSYIAQRMESLAVLFYLSSLYFYIRARVEKKNWFYPTAILLALFASMTKETSLTLPLAVVLYDFLFISKSLIKLIKKPFWLLLFLVVFGRYFLAAILPEVIAHKAEDVSVSQIISQEMAVTYETENITRENYMLTQIQVVPKYIQLVFLPIGQRLDYDIRLVTSFKEGLTPLYFSCLALIFSLALLFLKRFRLAAFGTIFFFLALMPSSSIIPIDDLIFEHRVYLPLLGFVFVFLEVVIRFASIKREKLLKAGKIFLLIWFIILCILTLKRNFLWSDKFKFWQDNYLKEPEKARVIKNYGVQLVKVGRLTEGLELINQAVAKEPDHPEYHLALAMIYQNHKEYDRAEVEYRLVLRNAIRGHEKVSNFYSLGVVQFKQEKTDEAIESFNQVLKINSQHYPSLIGLCTIYQAREEYQEAIKYCEQALDINRELKAVHQRLVNLYIQIGNIPKSDYHKDQMKVDSY